MYFTPYIDGNGVRIVQGKPDAVFAGKAPHPIQNLIFRLLIHSHSGEVR